MARTTKRQEGIPANHQLPLMSIHSAIAQDRFLRRPFCFLLVTALLFMTVRRLPAPIVEESATPALEQFAKPKTKHLKEKKAENSASSHVASSPSVSATKTPKATLPYGVPVSNKPDQGLVDVRGFPPGAEVKDPFTSKTFLVP